MSATTTLGYEYPVNSDPVKNYPAIIQALAQLVDDQLGSIKRGTVTINAVSVNTDYAQAVVFGTAFPGSPAVSLTISNKNNPASYEPPLVSSKTATGFTVNVRRSAGSASIDVDWIAVYQ